MRDSHLHNWLLFLEVATQ